ncbi:hypothetical protein E2C01_062457 [Portunus trituberculatus]|uniref:Uncharacterized protein n=1 Tax=Portunus trituberculatus TaxID=210409 RepID=A0A5B7HHC6_PORTR|nr:hypothetical protein [Portunus trituberculatus]
MKDSFVEQWNRTEEDVEEEEEEEVKAACKRREGACLWFLWGVKDTTGGPKSGGPSSGVVEELRVFLCGVLASTMPTIPTATTTARTTTATAPPHHMASIWGGWMGGRRHEGYHHPVLSPPLQSIYASSHRPSIASCCPFLNHAPCFHRQPHHCLFDLLHATEEQVAIEKDLGDGYDEDEKHKGR